MTDIVEFWGARPAWRRLPEELRRAIFARIQGRLAARGWQRGSWLSVHRCPANGLGDGEVVVIGFANGQPGDGHRPAIPEDELLSHYFEKLAVVWGERSAASYAERLCGGGRGPETI